MSVQTRMARSLKMPIVWVGFVLIILAFGTSDTLSGWGESSSAPAGEEGEGDG